MFLKRPGASAVYLTVDWIERWPRYACNVLVSVPLLAKAYPVECLSIWGCTLKPISASVPARSTRLAKPALVKGAPRSDTNTRPKHDWYCSGRVTRHGCGRCTICHDDVG